jgi:hypothetical protein
LARASLQAISEGVGSQTGHIKTGMTCTGTALKCGKALSKAKRRANERANERAVGIRATVERQDSALDKFLEKKRAFVVDPPAKSPPIPQYPPFAAPPAPDAHSRRNIPQRLWEDDE